MKKLFVDRREFLRILGLGAAAMVYSGCGGPAQTAQETTRTASGTGNKTLKILQQTHFVPAYDEWFDKEFAAKWGQENGIEVVVEHLPFADLYARAASEAASHSGHDLFGFASPPSAFENEVADLSDVVEEVTGKVGPMLDLAKKSSYNPKTNKWFGVVDFWAPAPVLWRKDLWEEAEPGSSPEKWDDLLRVGRKLKKMGNPLGIGLSPELDSNCALRGLLYSYGASLQDERGNVVINSPQTIEAIKMATALFKETMTPEVLAWSASSNNAYIASGSGSLVVNAISGLRAVEKKNADLAKNIWLSPMPAGPVKKLAPQNVLGVYVIWKFSENVDLAKKFLIDLITGYDSAFRKSESYNLPAFPGSVPELKQLLGNDAAADPKDKYAFLSSAEEWTTNIGFPGYSNAAENEVVDNYIIPKMFAMVAQDIMSAEDAAKWAEQAIKPIFDRWQSRGLV